MSTRISEDGRTRVAESVAGLSSASSLNDAVIISIQKEIFTIDPLTTGWLIGSGWAWDPVADNIEAV